VAHARTTFADALGAVPRIVQITFIRCKSNKFLIANQINEIKIALFALVTAQMQSFVQSISVCHKVFLVCRNSLECDLFSVSFIFNCISVALLYGLFGLAERVI